MVFEEKNGCSKMSYFLSLHIPTYRKFSNKKP